MAWVSLIVDVEVQDKMYDTMPYNMVIGEDKIKEISQSIDEISGVLHAILKVQSWNDIEKVKPSDGQYVIVVDDCHENPVECVYSGGEFAYGDYLNFNLDQNEFAYWTPVGGYNS